MKHKGVPEALVEQVKEMFSSTTMNRRVSQFVSCLTTPGLHLRLLSLPSSLLTTDRINSI